MTKCITENSLRITIFEKSHALTNVQYCVLGMIELRVATGACYFYPPVYTYTVPAFCKAQDSLFDPLPRVLQRGEQELELILRNVAARQTAGWQIAVIIAGALPH